LPFPCKTGEDRNGALNAARVTGALLCLTTPRQDVKLGDDGAATLARPRPWKCEHCMEIPGATEVTGEGAHGEDFDGALRTVGVP